MATVQRASMIQYPDGQVVIHNIRKKRVSIPVFGANESYSATLVDTWYDGTAMDDSKADGSIYFKLKALPSEADPSLEQYVGSYFRLNLPNEGELFLEKDTMQEMRDLNSTEILLIQMGYYKGVKLNGYYTKGDTPGPVEYLLSTTSDADDGGSTIISGDIKLEHDFIGVLDVIYFGAVPDSPGYDNAPIINKCIDYLFNKYEQGLVRLEKEYYVSITYNGGTSPYDYYDNCVKAKSGVNIEINGALILNNSDLQRYAIVSVMEKSDIKIFGSGFIQGDLIENNQPTGEWGRGVYVYDSQRVFIGGIKIFECFGDGIGINGLSGSNPLNEINGDIVVDNVEIYNCRRQGISLGKSYRTIISKSIIYNIGRVKGTNPRAGIDIEPDSGKKVSNTIIESCSIWGCSGGSIELHSLTTNARIIGCRIFNNELSSKGKQVDDVNKLLMHLSCSASIESSLIRDVDIYDNNFLIESSDGVLDHVVNITNRTSNVRLYDNTIKSDTLADVIGLNTFRAKNIAVIGNNITNIATPFTITTESEGVEIYNNIVKNFTLFVSSASTRNIEVRDNIADNSELAQDSLFAGIYGNKNFKIGNNRIIEVSGDTTNNGSVIRISTGSEVGDISGNIFDNSGSKSNNIINITGSSSSLTKDIIVDKNIFIITNNDLEWGTNYLINLSRFSRSSKVFESIVTNTVNSVPEYLISTASGSKYYPSLNRSTSVSDVVAPNATNASPSTATVVEDLVVDFNDLVIKYNTVVTELNEVKSKLNAKLSADRVSGQQAT